MTNTKIDSERNVFSDGRHLPAYHSYVLHYHGKDIKNAIYYGVFYGKRKPHKVMEVHYQAVLAPKKEKVYKKTAKFKPSYPDDIYSTVLSTMVGCYSDLATWETDTDGIYYLRKEDKRYTYQFVKYVYGQWGILVEST